MNNEQRLIRRYLARYRNLKVKEEYLQRELNELREDFGTSALHAIDVNGGGGTSAAHSPVPTYLIKEQELVEKISKRKDMAGKALAEIVGVIEMLSDKDYENIVVSCKYISRMTCDEIAEFIPCSRATVFRILDKAMDSLLEMPKVQEILKKYEKSLKY